MSKTAILLGATGLVGGKLLEILLNKPEFEKAILFSRSSCNVTHPKIEEHLIDMFNLKDHRDTFFADVVFCCIGTTKANTPDKETYKKIDYGIPLAAAKLSAKNGIETFEVISSMGANVNSSVFYNRIKGEMEEAVLKEDIDNIYIFQPSLIGGDRDEKRFGEKIAKTFMSVFSFAIPKKYKMIAPETIASAMVKVSKNGFSESRIPSNKIMDLGNDRN